MMPHSREFDGRKRPEPSSEAAGARMVRQRRADTGPETALRRELYRRGLRYRVDMTLPLKGVRRRADIVFTGPRLAVFVDGCY
jgi:DNA mismatch endonuclease (patch repair protein)